MVVCKIRLRLSRKTDLFLQPPDSTLIPLSVSKFLLGLAIPKLEAFYLNGLVDLLRGSSTKIVGPAFDLLACYVYSPLFPVSLFELVQDKQIIHNSLHFDFYSGGEVQQIFESGW